MEQTDARVDVGCDLILFQTQGKPSVKLNIRFSSYIGDSADYPKRSMDVANEKSNDWCWWAAGKWQESRENAAAA